MWSDFQAVTVNNIDSGPNFLTLLVQHKFSMRKKSVKRNAVLEWKWTEVKSQHKVTWRVTDAVFLEIWMRDAVKVPAEARVLLTAERGMKAEDRHQPLWLDSCRDHRQEEEEGRRVTDEEGCHYRSPGSRCSRNSPSHVESLLAGRCSRTEASLGSLRMIPRAPGHCYLQMKQQLQLRLN